MQSVGLLPGQETERQRMKVYTNIVDVISLCVPAGCAQGAVRVWFPLWCRGVGWGGMLCVNVRAKPRKNVAALRPPRSQGGLFWRAGSRVLIPHLCHHPQPDSS